MGVFFWVMSGVEAHENNSMNSNSNNSRSDYASAQRCGLSPEQSIRQFIQSILWKIRERHRHIENHTQTSVGTMGRPGGWSLLFVGFVFGYAVRLPSLSGGFTWVVPERCGWTTESRVGLLEESRLSPQREPPWFGVNTTQVATQGGVPPKSATGVPVNEMKKTLTGQKPQRTSTTTRKERQAAARPSLGKWPNPTLVVGFPKAGTNSIAEYFRCDGRRKVAHFRCQDGHFCGQIIERNVKSGRDPLQDTGEADVYSQMDVEFSVDRRLPCYFPQVEALSEIHKYHPNSTLVLNRRDPERWVDSVKRWSGMDIRLSKCDITGLPVGKGLDREDLKAFYQAQVERVRRFVAEHPSHRLVEVVIDDDSAGAVMEAAFGIDASKCWGWHNAKHRNSTGLRAGESGA